jgi:ParB family chromosome partitioning protein
VVVDGHRRLAGAREAGLDSVRVMVDDTRVSSDEALLEASFVANAQRENLTELEEAQALKSLVDFYGSQHKAAARLGLSQAVISQRLSLLHLTPELQADLQAGRRQVKHVRGLAKLNPEEQKEAADARAQDTKQEAESRRQNGKKPVLQTVPPAGGADSTDRAAESTGTGQDLAADRPRADAGVPRQSSAPHHSSSDAPPAGAEDQAYIDSLELPWDDPMWFDWVLRRRMTPENRTKLAWLLSAEEPSGA